MRFWTPMILAARTLSGRILMAALSVSATPGITSSSMTFRRCTTTQREVDINCTAKQARRPCMEQPCNSMSHRQPGPLAEFPASSAHTHHIITATMVITVGGSPDYLRICSVFLSF